MKDLEHQDVEEVEPSSGIDDDRPDFDFDGAFGAGLPSWWGKEQERACGSHVLCICGHEEREHCVPNDNDSRECIPKAVWDYDMGSGEEVVVDGGGCACMEFQAASPNLAFAL